MKMKDYKKFLRELEQDKDLSEILDYVDTDNIKDWDDMECDLDDGINCMCDNHFIYESDCLDFLREQGLYIVEVLDTMRDNGYDMNEYELLFCRMCDYMLAETMREQLRDKIKEFLGGSENE